MAILSNINDKFRVDSAGAVYFGTSAGTNGQILKSVGTGGSPVWINQTDITGPFVLKTGDTMTGNLAINGSNSLTVGGTISGGSSITGASIIGTSRVQSDDNMFMVGGQFYIGTSASNVDDTYRFYAASGVYYLQSRKSGTWTSYLEIASDGDATFYGSVTAPSFSGSHMQNPLKITSTYSSGNNDILFSGGSTTGTASNTTARIRNVATAPGGAATGNLIFTVNSGDAFVNALSLSNAGNATFAGDLTMSSGAINSKNLLFSGAVIPAANTPSINLRDSNNEFYFQSGSAHIFNFIRYDNRNSMMNLEATGITVQGGGNFTGVVGIGTTSATTALSVSDGASMYANSNYLVQIKRNATNGDDNTSKASILLANNSNAMQIAYGGSTDRLRFIDGGAVERLTMLNGGNIGIGTTSPDSLLVVQADAHNEAFAGKRSASDFLWFLRNENNSGRFQLFNSSSSQTIEMTGANGRINQAQMIAGTAFALSNGGFATLGSTSGSVPIAIAIDGDASTASIVVPTNKNVCIGGVYNYTGTGVTSLNINGGDYPLLAFYGPGGTLRTTIIAYSNNTLFSHPLSSAKWQFENGTGMMGELSGSGTLTVKSDVVAYGSPSDISLKENIKPIKNPLGKIKKLKGVTFDWKKSKSMLDIKEDYGFIAQDVKKIVPKLIRKNENGLLSMRHQGVIPILVEAIKELEARVKELENR